MSFYFVTIRSWNGMTSMYVLMIFVVSSYCRLQHWSDLSQVILLCFQANIATPKKNSELSFIQLFSFSLAPQISFDSIGSMAKKNSLVQFNSLLPILGTLIILGSIVLNHEIIFRWTSNASVLIRIYFTSLFAIGMEYVARYEHRYLWHSRFLWFIHASHHLLNVDHSVCHPYRMSSHACCV